MKLERVPFKGSNDQGQIERIAGIAGGSIGMTLGFLGDDFAILPDVDRRAVHAHGLSHDLWRF
jgi:hypothetical protein